jgi:outer membrane protein assembly factor BamB
MLKLSEAACLTLVSLGALLPLWALVAGTAPEPAPTVAVLQPSTVAPGGAAAASGQDRYFRFDHGVAAPSAGALPDRVAPDAGVAWKTPLDPGHSTPIVHGNRLFLTTCRVAERALSTVALDRVTGRELWRQTVRPDTLETIHPQMGNHATATPACDGQRVYVFFGSYGLLCYDVDGQPVWERRLGPFQDEYGAGSSPILVDDKVLLNQDHDRDSQLLAVSRTTGEVLWRQPRPEAVRSYATPVVWTRDGRKELLVAGALELVAYDPDRGEKLWHVAGLARIVIPSPVPSGEMIFMASWSPGGDAGARIALDPWATATTKWDANHDGRLTAAEIDNPDVLDRFIRMDVNQDQHLDQAEWDRHAEVFRRAQNALLALRPRGTGDLTDSAVVWRYPRGVPYVATPLVHGGSVWMVKDGGIVTRLEAATGKVLLEERLPAAGNYYASPVVGDEKIYFASRAGVVTVLSAGEEWRVLSSSDFKETIHATPVLDRGRVYIRTDCAVYACGRADVGDSALRP